MATQPAGAKSLEAALKESEDLKIPDEVVNSTADEISSRTKLIDNEIKFLKNEANRLNHEQAAFKEKIKKTMKRSNSTNNSLTWSEMLLSF